MTVPGSHLGSLSVTSFLSRSHRSGSVGAFFSNIQVYTGDQEQQSEIQKLVVHLQNILSTNGYEEIMDGSKPDRTIFIDPVSSNHWITIYDEETESQDLEVLDQLASAISQKTGLPSVGIVVHDSDLLFLRLFIEGRRVDTVVNNLELYNEMFEENRKRNGQPTKWKEYLIDGVTAKELKNVWATKTDFAEDSLEMTARILGWNMEACMWGYNLIQSGVKNSSYICLQFRDTKSSEPLFYKNSPSQLVFTSYLTVLDCSSNEIKRNTFGLYNEGQSFKGLRIVFWGQSIKEKFIEVTKGSICVLSSGQRHEKVGELKEGQVRANDVLSPCQLIDFPDFTFPDGVKFLKSPDEMSKKEFEFWLQTRTAYSMLFDYKGIHSGNADLHVSVYPMSHDSAYLSLNIRVFVDATSDEIHQYIERK